MKKTLLILSLLLSVALVSAQSDYGKFAYGFGSAGGQVGNTSFVMGMPFYSQYENDELSVNEGIMHAQLVRLNMVLEGCQNDFPHMSPAHVKDTTGFFLGYPGEDIVFNGQTINVFPAGTYDSTAFDDAHYNWGAQYNYDSLTTLLLHVWPIYEFFDTLYLDSTEIVFDYATNALNIPSYGWHQLHGGPNQYDLVTVEHSCDSIRHFFVNLCGGTVRDADGNPYPSLFIGTAPDRYCWLKSNLRTTHYNDNMESPSMIYMGGGHENEAENLATYGRLYDWNATVNVPAGSTADPAVTYNGGFVTGICPKGWHIPNSANINSLTQIDAMDLMSDILWLVPGYDTGAGFYALPSGLYFDATHRFENMLGMTFFWSSERHSLSESWVCSLEFGCNKVIIDKMSVENGVSVRCVKNQMFDNDGNELND